jgi:hypothetical protein
MVLLATKIMMEVLQGKDMCPSRAAGPYKTPSCRGWPWAGWDVERGRCLHENSGSAPGGWVQLSNATANTESLVQFAIPGEIPIECESECVSRNAVGCSEREQLLLCWRKRSGSRVEAEADVKAVGVRLMLQVPCMDYTYTQHAQETRTLASSSQLCPS